MGAVKCNDITFVWEMIFSSSKSHKTQTMGTINIIIIQCQWKGLTRRYIETEFVCILCSEEIQLSLSDYVETKEGR